MQFILIRDLNLRKLSVDKKAPLSLCLHVCFLEIIVNRRMTVKLLVN